VEVNQEDYRRRLNVLGKETNNNKGKKMKKFGKMILLAAVAVMLMAGTGCMRVYDTPEYVEVQPSQTAFVIPLEGDTDAQAKFTSSEFLNAHKVAAKRIRVPHRWNQTGRMRNWGGWIPTVKVITVERSPVTVELEANSGQTKGKDTAIWVESTDSVGFSMGWSITGFVKEEDTANFLYWYPSGSLEQVMMTEVRARVQQAASVYAAGYRLDDLRTKKTEIVDMVKADLIDFFTRRGITITTIGMFGGMTYENDKIQEAIDQTFITQQEKVNAKSMLDAQADKNNRIKSEAEALAEAARTKAKGEADGLESINSALAKAANNPQLLQLRALEVETARIKAWNGAYPNQLVGTGAQVWVGLNTPEQAAAIAAQ
jgi:hypothetical protein